MKTIIIAILCCLLAFSIAQIPTDLQGNYELTGELEPFLLAINDNGNFTAACTASCINNEATFNVTVTETEFRLVVESTGSSGCNTPSMVFELFEASVSGDNNIMGQGSLTIEDGSSGSATTVPLGDRCVLFDGSNLVFDVLNEACLDSFDHASQCVHGDTLLADSYIVSTNSTGALLPEGTLVDSSLPIAASSIIQPRDSSDASGAILKMLCLVPMIIVMLF
jgi:hypothetical protein